jgi:predicted alpha/beta superfamily hydrolase
MRRLIASLAVLALFAIGATVQAVADPLLPPHSDGLYSNVLHQQRSIDVYLPEESKDDPAARFETLYVLDGDWNARIVTDVVSFMRQVGFMPPVIVVSVPNHIDDDGTNSRDHDMTPTSSPDQAQSGGAKAFLAFLRSEFIPYVESHYPANGVRSIHGHSYGGLFLFYVLMNDPSLFGGYVVLDPAMGWDGHMFDAIAEAKLPTIPGKGLAFYVATRRGQPYERMGMAGLKPIFERRAPADLHWRIVQYPGETHDSLNLEATYDALKFVLDGYTEDDIDFVPGAGTLIRGKPLTLHVQNVDERLDLRYTTDGSTPDASSPKVGETIRIDDAAKARVKLVSNRGIYDRDVPLDLVNGSALRPSSRATATRDDRWHVALYPLDAWPDLRGAKPLRTEAVGHARDLARPDSGAFSASLTREFVVDTEGYYRVRRRIVRQGAADGCGQTHRRGRRRGWRGRRHDRRAASARHLSAASRRAASGQGHARRPAGVPRQRRRRVVEALGVAASLRIVIIRHRRIYANGV